MKAGDTVAVIYAMKLEVIFLFLLFDDIDCFYNLSSFFI